MYKPPIVGFAGGATAGKSTLSEIYKDIQGGYIYAFASPIKSMLKAGFGVDFSEQYWQDHKEKIIPALGKSPRELLQTLGTEWGRRLVGEQTWLILATGVLLSRGTGMIVPDVRFENEATWIRERGGIIIHVQRNIERLGHESEAGIVFQDGDFKFMNNTPLDKVYDKMLGLVRVIDSDHEETRNNVHE